MKFLGVREMRAGCDTLLKTLECEGEVILTRHGKPFARLLPYREPERKSPSLKAFRARQRLQKLPSSVGIRQERDER